MTFKHHVSFTTDSAANFGCDRAWHRFQAFARRLRDQFYSLSEANDSPKDWAKRWTRLWLATTSSQFHRNFHFTWKNKSDSSRPEIYKALIPCWLLNWVSTARVVALLPQASQSRPAATAAYSETPCVCACPSDPPKQCRRAVPWSWPLILPYKPSMTFWNSLGEFARWPAWAQTWTQTWTLPPDQWVANVLSPLKSQHKLCGVKPGVSILFKSVTDAKFEPRELSFLMLMPQIAP